MRNRIYILASTAMVLAIMTGTIYLTAIHPSKRSISAKSTEQKTQTSAPISVTPQQSTVPASQPPATVSNNNTAAPPPKTVDETKKETQTNPFQLGFSEWYVFNRRDELGKLMPHTTDQAYGNSGGYCNKMRLDGNTATTLSLYAIICRNSDGSTGVVEQINDDGSIWISEMNSHGQKSITDSTEYGGFYRIDYKLIPADNLTRYSFLN